MEKHQEKDFVSRVADTYFKKKDSYEKNNEFKCDCSNKDTLKIEQVLGCTQKSIICDVMIADMGISLGEKEIPFMIYKQVANALRSSLKINNLLALESRINDDGDTILIILVFNKNCNIIKNNQIGFASNEKDTFLLV